MKSLMAMVLMLPFTPFVNAQACGYTFLTIYLTDTKGNLIRNAEITTFDKNFREKDGLHYPRKNEENHDSMTNQIAWRDNKQAYLGSEGMCGGHREVGLRVFAENFEKFENVINLPLGWTSYSIKLKRKNFTESAQIIALTRFRGKIIDENKALIVSANLEIKDQNGKTFLTKSDSDGWFEIDLPFGKYTVKVSQNGFKVLKLINFNLEENKAIYSDLTLKVRDCDDCKGSILGKGYEKPIQEVILNYQKIKENQ